MAKDPVDFVPPTYDLRELGEGPAIHEHLERLADRMLAVAGEEVGWRVVNRRLLAHEPVG